MSYQNYEDYMRSVLGYSPYVGNDYTYTDEQEDIYSYSNNPMSTEQTQDLTPFYPEIYKIIYPMVCKVCSTNSNREITNELLEQMTDEIYKNVEPEDMEESQTQRAQQPPLKNGDVINPNAKEPEIKPKETRHRNYLLRDLIKILLLKEWGRPNRPPMRPPVRPPFPPDGRPPMRPGGPDNGRPPMNPPTRPRYY